jgi:hypothetical protein
MINFLSDYLANETAKFLWVKHCGKESNRVKTVPLSGVFAPYPQAIHRTLESDQITAFFDKNSRDDIANRQYASRVLRAYRNIQAAEELNLPERSLRDR